MRRKAGDGPPPRLYDRSLAAADRLDRQRGRTSAGALAGAWALLKLAALGLTAPLTGPLVGTIAARNRRVLRREITDFAAVVDELVAAGRAGAAGRATAAPDAGVPLPPAGRRLAVLPASGRYFISSDLHRSAPGTNDIPQVQGTLDLYAAALDHYATEGWTLVENGDAEEFWLLGGSAYGVHYDVWRTIAGALGPRGRELRDRVNAEHLRRIIGNNADVYRRIRASFLEHGRYVRLVGNHDDVFDDPGGRAELERWLPGVPLWDAVVLTDGDRAPAVITHGHLPDAWNAPRRNGLGKFAGVWASALYDAPGVRARPGVAPEAETTALLSGTDANRLVAVNPVLGAAFNLFTTDEVLLARSYRRRYGTGNDGTPLLVLGHTHAPRLAALDPDGLPWADYLNGGSGVAHRLVTGLEWDGTASAPSVALVGWHDPGGGVERTVLRRLDRPPGGAA